MPRHQPPQQQDLSRRDLIRRAACAGVTAAALASTVRDLRLINAAAADSPGPAPYRALVCLFLFGGNDANNLLVPTDDTSTGYQAYAAARKQLAIPAASLLPLNPSFVDPNDSHTYGLHPACTELQQLFESGQMAPVCNVGTLLAPITRAQYLAKSVPYPPQLFSHNDQVVQWQTSLPGTDSRTGWGGRMADLMNSLNNVGSVSMSVSLAGINTWEVGNVVNEYNMSTAGPQGLSTSNAEVIALNNALRNINGYPLAPAAPGAPQTNLYEKTYASVTKRADDNFAAVNGAIAATNESAPTSWVWQTPFPTSSLGSQLKMVARMIQARTALGHKRQIYFVAIGGYDLHDSQITVANSIPDPLSGAHFNLLRELSRSVHAFCKATEQLGVQNDVTLFTCSDFGRTFGVNGGNGSDHGWGNHQLLVGGGVTGKRLYGKFPTLAINGLDDTQLGRWIPTTAVDQYAATLAKWFGVSDTNLQMILPNLTRFPQTDLGFFTPPPPAFAPKPAAPIIVSSEESLAPAKTTTRRPVPTPRPAMRR
jgi:uncharacterized protein (DUF1501 family)